MSDLFKEMCTLSGKLNDLIDKTKDKDERQVVDFVKFNGMHERRLALFKYLSSGSGDDQLPPAVKWMLDDISDLLWNFDFKQMGFDSKNPWLIDGEMLQWEGYFFKTYYENEEYKRVIELLQKAGIFSNEVNSHKENYEVKGNI